MLEGQIPWRIYHVLVQKCDSLFFIKYHIKKAWSHSGAHWWRSTGRSVLSQRWADYQLWNNSMLTLPLARNLWSCVLPPLIPRITSPQSWLDVAIFYSSSPSSLLLTMTEVTAFSCLLSTRFTADMSYRTTCLCLSRTTALRCWDGPFLFMNVVTLRGPQLF